MKVLAMGDWHLGLSIGGYDYYDDIVNAVRYMIDEASEVDMVVQLGDLFHDGKPHPRLVATAMELIDELPCPGVFIVGNHDIGRGFYTSIDDRKNGGLPELYPLPDALEPFRKVRFRHDMYFPSHPQILEVDEFRILCAGYTTDAIAKKTLGWSNAQESIDAVFKEALSGEEIPKLAICHLDVEGARLGSETAVLRGGKLALPKSLASSLSCPVINGHIHRWQSLKGILMPGSVVATDFGSSDEERQYLVLEV